MIALILQSRFARWIGAAVMGALAVISFGYIKKREGVQAERAREAQRDAQALQRGAEGAAEGKAKLRTGKTPQQIKEDNDAKWD
jgi:hypothetical protein